jgi:transposase InsO family protein
VPLRVVTDSGSAFKSTAFPRFFTVRPWLEHIRTRHYSPSENDVVERFSRSLKYEHLYRLEIDAVDVHTALHLFRARSVQEA